MTDQPPDPPEHPAELSDEALEQELTIAASGSELDDKREDRFEELLEEREHSDDPARPSPPAHGDWVLIREHSRTLAQVAVMSLVP